MQCFWTRLHINEPTSGAIVPSLLRIDLFRHSARANTIFAENMIQSTHTVSSVRMRKLLLNSIAALVAMSSWSWSAATWAETTGDDSWTANAQLVESRTWTVLGLGDIQGISCLGGFVYLYGDVTDAAQHVGLIREFNICLVPTGRGIWLRTESQPVLHHPTGLTQSARWGTFIGDTVDRKAVIYRIDWCRALSQGELDHAVLDEIDDDAAINGCRPEFVRLYGKEYLATADYGDVRPEVRLYDPAVLLAAKRTSAPGAVAYRFRCGPFNQNLYWDKCRGELTCIQNVVAGRGWRLDVVNLTRAVETGSSTSPSARVKMETFLSTDELEGFRPLANDYGLFVTSSVTQNLTIAKIKSSARATAHCGVQ
jgi:hypothetical protein